MQHAHRSLCLVIVLLSGVVSGEEIVLRGGSLALRAEQQGAAIHHTLTDTSGVEYARGPAVYEMELPDGTRPAASAKLTSSPTGGISILVAGLPVEVIQEFERLPAGDGLVEHIRVTNRSAAPVRLKDYHFALQRRAGARGDLRAVAVPFRRQADGRLRDWSIEEIAAGKAGNSDGGVGNEIRPPPVIDSVNGRLRSEAWVLTSATSGVLIAKHNTEQIEFSTLAWRTAGEAGPAALRLGGSSFVLYREPDGMQLLAPGKTVQLGDTFYYGLTGDWPAGYERYREFLRQRGHALADDYQPPINWNELFDVGWYHSDPVALRKHYTKDALLAEARKAAEVGATMLYLDPGWEVCEGTTLWDESRLGPAADLVRAVREQFGLGLSFRTIGRVYRNEFPDAWYMRRTPDATTYERVCARPESTIEPVPTTGPRGERNLALLPEARATASSCLPGYPIHQVAHLNDGGYGNAASWISAGEPSWVEIDLGAVHRIDRVRFGSEHTPWHRDRTPTDVRILVAAHDATDAGAAKWEPVAESKGSPIGATRDFAFDARSARRVRVEILAATGGNARIDEIEIYETEAHPWTVTPKRPGAAPPCEPIVFWEVCTQCPEWQREKVDRIVRVAGAGMKFAMFDEFDWRGPCHSSQHGHAVPSTPLGHVRAVYGLIREVKRRVPGLLVEAHDPVWPWGVRYLPVYFDQSPHPSRGDGSYEENWGFEFMWNPIEDLVSGRALCLYYYNLGCDIPLYDHITAEKDNNACLAFWWYASTVRHLGIGGKKGLDSPKENPERWSAYRQAMARYRRLHDWFAKGRFIGIDELTHLHVLPGRPGGVVTAFNLTKQPVERRITLKLADLGATEPDVKTLLESKGIQAQRVGDALSLTLSIPALSPLVIEIGSAAQAPGRND